MVLKRINQEKAFRGGEKQKSKNQLSELAEGMPKPQNLIASMRKITVEASPDEYQLGEASGVQWHRSRRNVQPSQTDRSAPATNDTKVIRARSLARLKNAEVRDDAFQKEKRRHPTHPVRRVIRKTGAFTTRGFPGNYADAQTFATLRTRAE